MVTIAYRIIFLFFSLYIIFPWVLKIVLRRKFLSAINVSTKVCLTFDDGPNPKSTPEILKLLEEANAKATFFLLGMNAEKYPHLVEEIIKGGHEIGEHSYRHSHPWKCSPVQSMRDHVLAHRSLGIFTDSDKQLLFRPPYGKFNLIVCLYMLMHRKKPVFWNVNPRDYEQGSAEMIFRHVKKSLCPGAVILLHDGRPNGSHSNNVTTTVNALKLILQESKRSGLTMATVSESLTKNPVAQDPSLPVEPL